MDRRDFLTLRTGRGGRVVELSCRRLHLRHLELISTSADEASSEDAVSTNGEPPASFAGESVADVLRSVVNALQPGDTLRVVDRQWLSEPSLTALVEDLARAHCARGGLVER